MCCLDQKWEIKNMSGWDDQNGWDTLQCPPNLLTNRITCLPRLHQKPQLERLLKHPSNCLIRIWIKMKNEVGGLDLGWEPKCTVTIWAGAGVAVNEMFWGLMEWSKIVSSFFKCPTCCQTTARLFLNGTARSPHLTMHGRVIEGDIVVVLGPSMESSNLTIQFSVILFKKKNIIPSFPFHKHTCSRTIWTHFRRLCFSA